MSYARILHAVAHSPWAIHRPMLESIFGVLSAHAFPEPATAAPSAGGRMGGGGAFRAHRLTRVGGRLVDHSARIHKEAALRAQSPEDYTRYVSTEEEKLPAGQILHLFGQGILGKHLSAMDESCAGGLSVDRLQAALSEAIDDPKIEAVMLHLDTPGGVVTGIPETAALVRRLRETKVVAAFCDSLTASAGYWIASAADALYVTPSAEVGSIGVYSAVVDYTEWMAKQGIKVDLIKDGTYKGAGFMGLALTPEQRELIQTEVMELSKAFKDTIRTARPGVSDATMQGQCFTGARAVEARLADVVVDSLDDALADLSTQLTTSA